MFIMHTLRELSD